MQFDSLLGALKTGKIDVIISGMTTTPERKKEVDFSEPYMETGNVMLIRKIIMIPTISWVILIIK